MRSRVILDTGPLVALLNRRDQHHLWAKECFAETAPPLLTCEAVISEACFLVRSLPPGPQTVIELLQRGVLAIPFRLNEEANRLATLLARYASVPMSLADASGQSHQPELIFEVSDGLRLLGGSGSSNKSLAR